MRCEFCPNTYCTHRLTAGPCHVMREEIEIVNAPNTKPYNLGNGPWDKGYQPSGIQDPIRATAFDLVDAVERYMRQECLRIELAMKKDKLKELLK